MSLRLDTSLAVAEASSQAARALPQSLAAVLQTRYDLVEVLSQGTTGVVQRAIRREDGREVALKIVRSTDEEMVLIQKREYEVLRSLDHPYIVRALEFFTTTDRIVMVMDFFAGEDLSVAVGRADGGRLSEEISRGLALPLAQAVEYLHNHHVIHRDIKPQNVMVSKDLAHLKLVDFNTSGCDEDGACLTMTGTFLYVAPEVVLGESPAKEGDVWSVGLCLHFMVSGYLPQGRDALAKADIKGFRLRCVVPTSFNGPVWEGVSQPCKAVLERCLAIDPQKRPTAHEVVCLEWFCGLAGSARPSPHSEGPSGDL